MTSLDTSRPFLPVRIAVLTVSDTRSLSDDKSGDTLADRITGAGHVLKDRAVVKDDLAAIVGKVSSWIESNDIDVVITFAVVIVVVDVLVVVAVAVTVVVVVVIVR